MIHFRILDHPIPVNVLETQTLSLPIIVPSPLSTRTPIPFPATPTFPPTIGPNQQSYLLTLLQSKSCELPCYLEITPGKTSWDDAQTILSKIGAHLEGSFQEDGLPAYGYSLWVGDPMFMNVTRNPNMGVGDMEIYQDLSFTIGDGKVQRIYLYTQTVKLVQKFGEYWSRYSMLNVFHHFGPPDLIFLAVNELHGGYIQFTVYSKLGIVIETNGIKEGNQICPISLENNKDIYLLFNLTLTNLTYPLKLYDPGRVPPTDRSVYLPIQEVLGIKEIEYYVKYIADPSSCFNVIQFVP
jgi:hypothetical protein